MKALITGISGQDGSYLAELLLSKGYEVHGVLRRASSINTERIKHILPDLHTHLGDLSDSQSIENVFAKHTFEEVYNLGAQSDVRASFDVPEYTGDVTGLGALRLLELCRAHRSKFYQASSSELFGKALETPQSEKTPFYPRSPYGVAKQYAFWSTVNYRESYDMFACNGILFNHESPRRGTGFVTQKITKAAVNIYRKKQLELRLGNLDARRDWGYAKDYVEGMWMMMQQPKPDDFVLATGETHSIREFLDEAFDYLHIDWHQHVAIDPELYRPAEVDLLLGDASKAKRVLGWEPKVKFKELVRLMVDAELFGERQFCSYCGAGTGRFRRFGEGTCPKCEKQ
jgi:GDPmannose 4,6-dehydratase